MDPCRGGRFVLEHREDICRHKQPRAASAEVPPCSCRAPELCPPRAVQQCHCHHCHQCHHCHTSPILLLPSWSPGLAPIRAGLQPMVPQAEAALSPPQQVPWGWHRGWAAATSASGCTEPSPAPSPAHFLLLFYFLSPAAARGWSHGPLVFPGLGYKL